VNDPFLSDVVQQTGVLQLLISIYDASSDDEFNNTLCVRSMAVVF